MTPEGKVKAKVKVLFAKVEVPSSLWSFMPVSNGMGAMGIPDFIGLSKGRMFCVETKAKASGAPTRLQEITMSKIAQAGGRVFIICGVDSPVFGELGEWLAAPVLGDTVCR